MRQLPAQEPRVETGPTKFGDDWAGVFIRGDNALGYAMELRAALRYMPANLPFMALHLRSLAALLEQAAEGPAAQMIQEARKL